MTDQMTLPPIDETEKHAEWLEPLKERTFWFAVAVLYVTGLILAGSPNVFRKASHHVWFSLFSFFLIGLTALLHRWRPGLAAWCLVLGSTTMSVLTVTIGGLSEGIWFVLLPIGLLTLVIGIPWGGAAAVVYSLAIWLVPRTAFPVPQASRTVTIIGIWTTVGLLWLTVRSLLSPLNWAWSSFEDNRLVLDEALDKQVRLLQTTEELATANLQLSRLNRLAQSLRQSAEDERAAKEKFVANVSHELRTPLNMIIGFCEMITEAPETYGEGIPASLLADLNVVLRNSQHLSSLIDDVLDISQVEIGQMALTKERVSLSEIIQAAALAVRPLFESKELYLKTSLPSDLPQVMCDQTRIREVVLNLLSNAGRFTEHGGVEVKAYKQERDVVVSVTDTGPGIGEEHRAKLFTPFEQIDNSIRRRYGGTGLGLSISKSFVELHEGAMWVESKVGQGTTFFFSLPISPRAPLENSVLRWYNPYEPYEQRPRRSRLKAIDVKPRLVVLEEGDSMQRFLRRYLDGTEIVSSSSLEQAIEELSRTPAQLLLINDLHTGDALEKVRETHLLPYGVPAVVCAIPGTGQATDALGVSDYLVKPISRQAMLACLDHLSNPVKKILLVDDEPDALRLFSRMLSDTDRGYQVIRASNGAQALELLRKEIPDVLLLDLMMPEMDGFQLLSIKNKDQELRAIPVVLISARDPLGQPIIGNSLAVTCRRGMSAREILACVDALSQILSYASAPADRALTPASLD